MPNLPKYYFQDIPSAVMEEIVQAMMASKPELELEEMDDFLNRNNRPATVSAWYERAEEFVLSR
jgi:hypothetical protein